MSFQEPKTPLEAAHEHLSDRYHHAGSDRGDGMATDWSERDILNPLVDVADMLRRIADHRDSAHYRAEKAGPLLHSAARANRETMLAYAGWPDDDTPEYKAIVDATDLLLEVITKIRNVMWAEARGELHDREDSSDLLRLADRFAEWARNVHSRAVDHPKDT